MSKRVLNLCLLVWFVGCWIGGAILMVLSQKEIEVPNALGATILVWIMAGFIVNGWLCSRTEKENSNG